MHGPALWYATRGTGAVSLLLLTGVVLLGITSTFHWQSRRLPKFLVHGLHRNLTLLALAFLAVHVGTAVLDSYAPIRLLDTLVPFVSSYRPLWLGLGTVAFDLLLALTATSLLRARIGARLWRRLHWLAYAAWPVAVVHGLGTGTDARAGWLQALTAACVLATVGAVLARAGGDLRRSTRIRVAGGTAALLLPALLLVWAERGPLAAGWARRSGTPTALLGGGHAAARLVSVRVARTPSLPDPPFRARFAGTLAQSRTSGGQVEVSIRARTTSGPKAVLRIDLVGDPVVGGGVQMTASAATLGPAAALDEYTGTIVALDGSRVALGLRSASGRQLAVQVALGIDGGRVRGILAAGPGEDAA